MLRQTEKERLKKTDTERGAYTDMKKRERRERKKERKKEERERERERKNRET